MPSAFHGIGTMSSALSAFQRAIDVTGNNIANVNTAGYSRQRVNIQSNSSIQFWSNGNQLLGSGVTVGSITRARDYFVDRNASRNFSDLGHLGTLASGLEGIDSIYGEPSETGIASSLGKMFDAFSALASNPGQPANRIELRRAAIQLTDRIQTASENLTTLQQDARELGSQTFQRINQLATQIADLNKQIASVGADGNANPMLDARQSALDELSSLVRVDSTTQANGTVTLTVGSNILVDQGDTRPLGSVYDPGSTSFDPAMAGNLRGGSLLGHIETLRAAQDHLGRLDTLADNLRESVNNIHRSGRLESGATDLDFFDSSTTGASDFRVTDAIKASADAIVVGTSGEPGDGGIAQSIAALRDTQRGTLGNKTFSDYFKDTITMAASDARATRTQVDTEAAVGMQIEAQRQAVSGVSLDEEFAEMVKLQRSYQAASRALNVFNEITEDLLGIVR